MPSSVITPIVNACTVPLSRLRVSYYTVLGVTAEYMDRSSGAEILTFPVISVTVPRLVWIRIHTPSQDANYVFAAASGLEKRDKSNHQLKVVIGHIL